MINYGGQGRNKVIKRPGQPKKKVMAPRVWGAEQFDLFKFKMKCTLVNIAISDEYALNRYCLLFFRNILDAFTQFLFVIYRPRESVRGGGEGAMPPALFAKKICKWY